MFPHFFVISGGSDMDVSEFLKHFKLDGTAVKTNLEPFVVKVRQILNHLQ